jgi:hypothetical protein
MNYTELLTYYATLSAQLSEGHRQAVKLEKEVESEDVRVVADFLVEHLEVTNNWVQQLVLELEIAERRGY